MSRRRVITTLDVGSVARVTFAVTLAVWGIVFVGVVALYLLGLVSGGLGGVEGFIASLGFTGFRLSILPFLAALVAVAVIASGILAVVTGVIAFLYNAVFPIVGGLELTTRERSRRRPATITPAPQPPSPPLPVPRHPHTVVAPLPPPSRGPDVPGGRPSQGP